MPEINTLSVKESGQQFVPLIRVLGQSLESLKFDLGFHRAAAGVSSQLITDDSF